MKRIGAFLGLTFIGPFILSVACGQTIIDAEFRPRTEFRQGFRKPLADTLDGAFVTLQRSRFNADYQGKILNARISLQDSRIWGNSNNKTNTSKIELYEAWFEYLISSGFSVKIGRQQLKYDDQRLLAASNWSNTGISHDIALFKYNNQFIQVHTGFAYNNTKDTLMNLSYTYPSKQNYKTMGYVWVSKKLSKIATLSLIGICEGFEKKTDYKTVYPRITYGGNLIFAGDSTAWTVAVTTYLQGGKTPLKTYGKGYANLNAYFVAAKFAYKFTSRLTANIGFDYYSGSATTIDAGQSKTFERLYGATHSFNGNMEYFSSLPTQGLIDYFGGITSKLSSKLSIEITGHMFSFDKDFIYKNEKISKNLGTELDLVLKYVINKEINIEGGYSKYFRSDATSKYYKMPGVDTHSPQWCYVMLTVKPQFYKTPQQTATN